MKRILEIELALGLALILTVVLSSFTVVLSSFTGFAKDCEGIREKVFRLHVIANSDSAVDQELKLNVRDRIIAESRRLFYDLNGKDEIVEEAKLSLKEIEAIAESEIEARGYSYNVKAEVLNMHFTTREYGDVTLPAGNYDALRITIGEGRGHNWWCVMFPPMCLPAASEKKELGEVLNKNEMDIAQGKTKYKVKFKAVEVFEDVKRWFK